MPSKIAGPHHRASKRKESAPRVQRRTNIVLDMQLVEQAKKKLKVRTTREAVAGALAKLVEAHDYSDLLSAYGSGGIREDYDPKTAYAPHKSRA